jgi:hypothetical protein
MMCNSVKYATFESFAADRFTSQKTVTRRAEHQDTPCCLWISLSSVKLFEISNTVVVTYVMMPCRAMDRYDHFQGRCPFKMSTKKTVKQNPYQCEHIHNDFCEKKCINT